MIIYGVMVLGLCMFVGTSIGLTLGIMLGIPGDIGGVGFSMLLLVFLTPVLKKKDDKVIYYEDFKTAALHYDVDHHFQ